MGGDGKTKNLMDCPKGTKGFELYTSLVSGPGKRDATRVADRDQQEAAHDRRACIQHNLWEGASTANDVALAYGVIETFIGANRTMNEFGAVGGFAAGLFLGPEAAPGGFYAGRVVGLGVAIAPVIVKDQLIPVGVGTPWGLLLGAAVSAINCK